MDLSILHSKHFDNDIQAQAVVFVLRAFLYIYKQGSDHYDERDDECCSIELRRLKCHLDYIFT